MENLFDKIKEVRNDKIVEAIKSTNDTTEKLSSILFILTRYDKIENLVKDINIYCASSTDFLTKLKYNHHIYSKEMIQNILNTYKETYSHMIENFMLYMVLDWPLQEKDDFDNLLEDTIGTTIECVSFITLISTWEEELSASDSKS